MSILFSLTDGHLSVFIRHSWDLILNMYLLSGVNFSLISLIFSAVPSSPKHNVFNGAAGQVVIRLLKHTGL